MSGGNGMFCLHCNLTNFINSNSLIKCRYKRRRRQTKSMSKQQQRQQVTNSYHCQSIKQQSNILKLKNHCLAFIVLVAILSLVATASSNLVPKNPILEKIYPSRNNNYSQHQDNHGNNNQHIALQDVHRQAHPQFTATMSKFVKLGDSKHALNNRAFNSSSNQIYQYSSRADHPNHSNYSRRLESISALSSQSSYKQFVGAQSSTLPIVSSNKFFEQVNQQVKKVPQISDKICIGTLNLMTDVVHDKAGHCQNLAERYINCTFVIGNLEISWIDEGADLSFLESIREITGYLLIAHVNVDTVSMPNLQIIRGRDLFKYRVSHDQKEHEFALILIENEIKSLELPNLKEILAGNFGSYYNNNLCFIRESINWEEIINSPPYRSMFAMNASQPVCPPCDSSCMGNCWGEGPHLCQTTSTKKDCSAACNQGRCFGSLATECCHSFCAGGCSGPKQTDCFACKHFRDGDACVPECPSIQIYNPTKFLWETNPNGKYAFGATCVKECPEHLLRDNGACVRFCPPNKRSVNGECVPCGGPCPKNCQGVEVVHSGNIDQLINCTVIEGSITILDSSFTGHNEVSSNDTMIKYKPMHPSRLEVFKTIREITGYLYIRANHSEFKNLSCFKNLQIIGGRQTTEMFYSLSIIRTSLVELNLHSLRKVRLGRIMIEENKDLCFADTIDWLQINITRREDITTRNNAETTRCRALGLQCHEQCAKDGCWGPGPDECLSCNNYKLEDYCIDNCTSIQANGILSYDSGSNTCKKCHPECKEGCNGTEAYNCFSCKNVKDGPYCVSECPSHKFNNNGTCEECDKSCVDGCTGPSNRLGEGGCNSCSKTVINSTDPIFLGYCTRAEEACPEGYYQEYVEPRAEGPLKSSSGKPVCRKCHHQCKRCTGMGPHIDVCECAKYTTGEQCEDFCRRDYFADESTKQCLKCSPECNGCFGPTEADCISCKVYRIYYDTTDGNQPIASAHVSIGAGNKLNSFENGVTKSQVKFNCTGQCPSNKPHRITESNMLDPYCSEVPDVDPENPHILPMGSTSIIFMIITSAAITSCIIVYRYHEQDNKTLKLSMRLSGIDDVEPLTPSNLKPNLSPLRSIQETELRKGKVLGQGFGGTVYQGYWHPDNQEHKKPIPVAIKVLRDNGQSNMNKEFLDEAYILATVNHPNLVRLLAICTTPNHQMLITQLMPLGCLLEHVKKFRNEIGSKSLLEWCKQIANGMAYLEEKRMVHRDLALRNVLLQTTGKALISDFGLAKFLEVNQSEYHSGGGRLPIKWLAPECIRERKFTHKSDVWAFGVTVWELVTFGMRPFEEYDTKDLLIAIVSGARLQQPNYVSTEVYTVMFSCWFYNPDNRPNFRSLVQNFVKFARDPARYISVKKVIQDYNSCKQHNLDLDASVDEDCDCDSDTNSMIEEDSSQPPLSGMPDLTPNTHNRLNEAMFGFEMRHHNSISESDDQNQSCLPTPTFKKLNMHDSSRQHLFEEDMLSTTSSNHRLTLKGSIGDNSMMTDANNNNFTTNNNNKMSRNSADEDNRCHANSCWSMHHTVSTNSIGQKSELPTDTYDYLLPSQCIDDHSHLSSFYSSSYDPKSIPVSPRSGVAIATSPTMRNPPHSAGLLGVNNDEYFITRSNYANHNLQQDALDEMISQCQLSTSTGNIPNSLV